MPLDYMIRVMRDPTSEPHRCASIGELGPLIATNLNLRAKLQSDFRSNSDVAKDTALTRYKIRPCAQIVAAIAPHLQF